jgi:homoserine kinase
VTSAFTVTAPCSTSNLGAGFDALGIALGGPRLVIRCKPAAPGQGLRITDLTGLGKDSLPRDATNRVLVAAQIAARGIGADYPSFSGDLTIDNSVPLARGLGSSAAAAVAGALLAEALHARLQSDWHANDSGSMRSERFDDARVLATALSMEGHPDNVIACLRGGAQVAVLDAGGVVRACPITPPVTLRAAIFIPDQELKTSEARAVIPRTVPLADAVFNLSRAALFVAAMAAGRFELIGEAMGDRLHQPPRTALMPWLPDLIQAARDAGALGAALSGAGTTVFSLCLPDDAADVAEALRKRANELGVPGSTESVEACALGARIES